MRHDRYEALGANPENDGQNRNNDMQKVEGSRHTGCGDCKQNTSNKGKQGTQNGNSQENDPIVFEQHQKTP